MKFSNLIVSFLLSVNCFAEEAVVVWYSEQEAGVEPYRVRYIVTDKFLRSDDGGSEHGFILLDRQQKKICNIVPAAQSILEIDGNAAIPVAPESFAIKQTQTADPAVPKISGKAVHEIRVSSEKQLCYTAMVVPGLHDEVRQAFLEFKQILAVQQSRTLEATPVEMRTDCFMIQNLFAPGLHLLHGLPVHEWNKDGWSRQLIEFQTMPQDSALFDLPSGYRHYSP